ncbi:MAG: DUF3098 domain-containing protein [Bacteroidales bacterium]|nr:DUF3098 domain-containing protein [Bacteroidales bacterium]
MATKKKQVSKKPSSANVKPAKDLSGVRTKPADDSSLAFAFGKENYRLLLIGLFVIMLGFLLMIGGGSDDPNVFSEDIFSFRRMTLAPILVLAGYIIEIFAIMKKPKD